MKISSAILISMLVLLVTTLFASNLLLKKHYNQLDRSDLYWNYNKILEKPFKHLKIEGGNITQILFEQNKHCSVRVLDYWEGYKKDSTVKAYVLNDTLHLKFLYQYVNLPDKYWMQSHPIIRIAAPELQSVDGFNTNVELDKLHQKSLSINLSGKSRIEVESNIHNFDTLNVTQVDSSQVIVEMNPDLKGSPTMSAQTVNGYLRGITLLDIGHVQVNNLRLNTSDTSAVILSGRGIKTLKNQYISK